MVGVDAQVGVDVPQPPPLPPSRSLPLKPRTPNPKPIVSFLPCGAHLGTEADRVLPTQDQLGSNLKSQFRRFWGDLTPKVDQGYLRGRALEPLLFAIDMR